MALQGPVIGSTGKGTWGQATCPAGMVVTGVQAGSDGYLTGLAGVRCKYPRDIESSGAGSQSNISGVSMPPSANVTFDCPAGFAANNVSARINTNVDGLQLGCARFADNAGQLTSPLMGQSGNYSTWAPPVRNFLIGLNTQKNGNRIGTLQPVYQDFTPAITANYTPAGIADGCMGIGDPTSWKYQPGSGDCDKYMVTNFCQAYPTDPRCSCISSEMTCPNKFDQNCIKNNGYRTADMQKVACPNVMNCIQYNRLSSDAKAIAVNYDQNCSSSSNSGTSGSSANTTAGMSWSQIIVWIFIAFVILVAIGGGLYAAATSSKTGRAEVSEVDEKINPGVMLPL